MTEIKMLIIIGAGGFCGAVLRYSISSIATRGDFPYGTLFVNFIGSFILGFILFLSFYSGYDSPEARNFLAIGLLGHLLQCQHSHLKPWNFLMNVIFGWAVPILY